MLNAILLVIGLGSTAPEGPGPYLEDSAQSQALREAQLAHDATVVIFEKGEAGLSDSTKDALSQLVTTSRAAGSLRLTHVAAWSDREYADASALNFPEADRKLAAKRAAKLADFLRDELGVRVVTTYNLADGTTRLDKAFDTADAELKDILSGERAPQKGQRVELRLFRDLGRASSAVVVVEHDRTAGAPTN